VQEFAHYTIKVGCPDEEIEVPRQGREDSKNWLVEKLPDSAKVLWAFLGLMSDIPQSVTFSVCVDEGTLASSAGADFVSEFREPVELPK